MTFYGLSRFFQQPADHFRTLDWIQDRQTKVFGFHAVGFNPFLSIIIVDGFIFTNHSVIKMWTSPQFSRIEKSIEIGEKIDRGENF
jgi:hypothetical protein